MVVAVVPSGEGDQSLQAALAADCSRVDGSDYAPNMLCLETTT